MRLLAFFIAGAVATSVKRATGGIEAVTEAMGNIGNNTDELTTAITNFQDGGDLANILDATVHLRAALDDGNSVVDATQPFTESEALTLTGPTGSLSTSVQNSINATIAKIPLFEANNLIAEVQYQLTVLQQKSTVFQTNLIALVPEDLKSLADTLAAPITTALQRGVDAFNAAAANSTTNAASMSSPSLQMGGIVAAAGLAFLAL